jgi:hypothetical protein
VTKQAIQKIQTNKVTGGVRTRGEVSVTRTRILSEIVEKSGYVPNSFEKLGSHRLKTPKPGYPIIGVGTSTETVQYRFTYGKKSLGLKVLDLLIKINQIQSGNIQIYK